MANVTVKTNGVAKNKTKKGFTLIEIIFVTVIIAMLAGMIIPKILENAKKTEYTSVFNEDLRSIKTALEQYKANGGEIKPGFDISNLKGYLPSSFVDTGAKSSRGFPYYADKNGDIIRFSIHYEGSPEFYVSFKKWGDTSRELKEKMLEKLVKEFGCEDSFVSDTDKELKASFCHL